MRRVLIGGGRLIDGTGAAARAADLLIEGDRIADLFEPNAAPAPGWVDLTLDARGLTVCPGFIDIHSHGDLILAAPLDRQRRLLEGRIAQGITTEVVGNCGLGVFPRTDASEPLLRAVVSWMTPQPPGDNAGGGEAVEDLWPWSDLASYLAHVEGNGTWINVAALQPHGPLRIEQGGLTRPAGAARDGAVARGMARRLEAALDAGAFGMSTGLIYPPGIFTPTEEIVALARVVARRCRDRAFVASHIRGSSETLLRAVEELIQIGRDASARVHHSHSEAVGRRHWPEIERVLRMEDAARSEGIQVAFDMFPYTAAATMMLAIYPPWAVEGGVEALLGRLADPAGRSAVREAIDTVEPSWPPWVEGGWPHNLVRAVGWDAIVVGSVGSEHGRRFEGMSLTELGRARGAAPFDAISDLMIEENGKVSQIIHGVSGDEAHEEGIEMLLSDPHGCVCTDANDFGKGRPHPASWGTFPRVLGRYVRERSALALEEAIHRMTGRPAGLLGLADRGVLRRGACADVVVFDPRTVGSDATYAVPRRAPSGIAWVIVNGSILLGPPADAGPAGRVLRRSA